MKKHLFDIDWKFRPYPFYGIVHIRLGRELWWVTSRKNRRHTLLFAITNTRVDEPDEYVVMERYNLYVLWLKITYWRLIRRNIHV